VGVAIKNISKTSIEGKKIPIPSLERQEEIVKYLEYNDTHIKQLEKEIENNRQTAQKFMRGIIKLQSQIVSEKETDSGSESSLTE
jgi:restriction endonuclease S subunit